MIGYPSNVLVVADYPNPRFDESIRVKVDFVLSSGDVDRPILEEIYLRFRKPIFAVKGNRRRESRMTRTIFFPPQFG